MVDEDPERATLAFVVGNVAASADQDVVVLLTIDGVWLATKGYAEEIHKEGFQPLRDVMQSFLSNGGQIWACGSCATPRGITDGRSDRGREDRHGGERGGASCVGRGIVKLLSDRSYAVALSNADLPAAARCFQFYCMSFLRSQSAKTTTTNDHMRAPRNSCK